MKIVLITFTDGSELAYGPFQSYERALYLQADLEAEFGTDCDVRILSLIGASK